MQKKRKLFSRLGLASLATGLLILGQTGQAQTTTPNVKVEILGVGAGALLGSPLTDPEMDGVDALGMALDPAGNWNWVGITASHEPDFEGGENSFNIFDHKVGGGNDKWCCDDPTPDNPVWVAVEFAKVVSITHFTVASGNDSPDRDPTDWAIQGSNDGVTYKDIYRFYDTTVPWTERNQVVKFTLPLPSAAYKFIRYIAYDTPGSLHQINEVELFGIVGGANQSDADNDGMPNDWETQYGFNPNDASDAAKDANGNGISNLDEYKLGYNPLTTTKPAIVSAVATATFDTVKITFTMDLDAASATNLANYALSPSLAITAASYKARVVTLTTAKQTAGAVAYTVSVTGVKSINNFAIGAGAKATFYSFLQSKAGALKFSYWGGITGTPVQGLYDDPRYPATPDLTAAVYSFNSRWAFPDDSHENYGATMEGFLTPTESADYRFFVYSDDASELYLSTDATEANLALIAQETGCCNNFTEPGTARTSEPVSLVAGKKYFIRMVYKEGGGGDYGQVAWRKEGDTTAAGSLTPIPGKYLSAAVDLPAPPDGLLVTQSPAPNAKNVSPIASVTVVHIDGKTEWTSTNTSLKFNGAAVTPTFTKDGTTATIAYKPATMFASKTTNTATLTYKDPGGNDATLEWTFVVAEYRGPIKDAVKAYSALLLGTANYTADKGGHTGKAGDYAIDLTTKGGPVQVIDPLFLAALNEATAKDELSVGLWIKKYDIADSSAIWFSSPTQGRVFQAHTPWSNNNIYFDTAGCCDGGTQRINAGIDTFADYTGDIGWWTNNWHYFVFNKKADAKDIWIDGKPFLAGSNTGLLSKDINQFNIGADNSSTGGLMHGLVDDVAVFSKILSEADMLKIVAGTLSPKDVSGVLAVWDFNDAAKPEAPKFTGIVKNADGTFTVTWTGGGTLQASPTVNGPYTDVPGATSPYKVTPAGASLFGRIRQ